MMAVAAVSMLAAGCAHPQYHMDRLELGMTPDQVTDVLGRPYTVRASKVYESSESMEVWEYLPRAFTWYPKSYWVFFENGQVVQWGEPGDFAGQSGGSVPVSEYINQKRGR